MKKPNTVEIEESLEMFTTADGEDDTRDDVPVDNGADDVSDDVPGNPPES